MRIAFLCKRRYMGKDVASLDLQAMITGKAKYGQDMSLPGMRIAVIQRMLDPNELA